MRMLGFLLLLTLLAGCASGIAEIGTIPGTAIDCHAVQHRDTFLAMGMIVCVKEGEVQAAAGGAAAGPAGIAGSFFQGAGSALGGLLMGEALGQALRGLATPPGGP